MFGNLLSNVLVALLFYLMSLSDEFYLSAGLMPNSNFRPKKKVNDMTKKSVKWLIIKSSYSNYYGKQRYKQPGEIAKWLRDCGGSEGYKRHSPTNYTYTKLDRGKWSDDLVFHGNILGYPELHT
jgi:hypothetical protein